MLVDLLWQYLYNCSIFSLFHLLIWSNFFQSKAQMISLIYFIKQQSPIPNLRTGDCCFIKYLMEKLFLFIFFFFSIIIAITIIISLSITVFLSVAIIVAVLTLRHVYTIKNSCNLWYFLFTLK